MIGCINDERLRIEFLNATSIRKKRSHVNSSSTIHTTRPRFSDNTPSTSSCRFCKKTNHSTNDCRFKPLETKREASNKDSKTPIASVCTYCKKPGHTYEACFTRQHSLTSNVNCVASIITGSDYHQNRWKDLTSCV